MVFLQRLTAFLVLVIATVSTVSAQYVIKKPDVGSREFPDLHLDAVRCFPDSLIFDFTYNAGDEDGGYRVMSDAKLVFPADEYNINYTVSNLINADYEVMKTVKRKRSESFSVVFPFSLFELSADLDELFDFFADEKMFVVDFKEISDKDRVAKKVKYGTYFNMTDINLAMPYDNWAVLWCAGMLNRLLEKDEFESTADFKKRTVPDTVNFYLNEQITAINAIFNYRYNRTIGSENPTMKYDADKEEFTITYPKTEKLIIGVPIKQAPEFKKNIEDVKWFIHEEVIDLEDGTYYIKSISLSSTADKNFSRTYKNKYTRRSNPENEKSERIKRELKKMYPKAGIK